MVKPLVGNVIPEGIVQPESEQELVDLVRLAQANKIKLTPRGRATSGYGGVLPIQGGLVVEFNRLNHIIDILDLPNESSWLKLRGLLIDGKGYHTFPPFEMMVNTMRQHGNIWGSYAKDRDAWITNEIRPMVMEKAEYVFFPGCTSSFVEQDVAMNIIGRRGNRF